MRTIQCVLCAIRRAAIAKTLTALPGAVFSLPLTCAEIACPVPSDVT